MHFALFVCLRLRSLDLRASNIATVNAACFQYCSKCNLTVNALCVICVFATSFFGCACFQYCSPPAVNTACFQFCNMSVDALCIFRYLWFYLYTFCAYTQFAFIEVCASCVCGKYVCTCAAYRPCLFVSVLVCWFTSVMRSMGSLDIWVFVCILPLQYEYARSCGLSES